MSAIAATWSVCEPVDAVPAAALRQNWLREAILGQQMPRLVQESGQAFRDWQAVGLHNLAQKLSLATPLDLLVSPSGVVGHYKPSNVHITMRDGRIFGRARAEGQLPQEDIELPHLQIENKLTLGQYLAVVQDPAHAASARALGRAYLRFYGTVLPAVAQYMPASLPQDADVFTRLSLYLSQAGTTTNLHVDLHSGVIHQLKGRKRVTLFAPDAAEKIKMHPQNHILARRAQFGGRLTDAILATHPDFAHVRGYTCIIAPNQWLYLPAHWLHHVETLDTDTISLVTRFKR